DSWQRFHGPVYWPAVVNRAHVNVVHSAHCFATANLAALTAAWCVFKLRREVRSHVEGKDRI
ncbi:MAG TPA: hypothetical protein VKB78_06795, partial [Pirellulales bacterium]|nr:hypothetical protein [Pirellulales bacterium]